MATLRSALTEHSASLVQEFKALDDECFEEKIDERNQIANGVRHPVIIQDTEQIFGPAPVPSISTVLRSHLINAQQTLAAQHMQAIAAIESCASSPQTKGTLLVEAKLPMPIEQSKRHEPKFQRQQKKHDGGNGETMLADFGGSSFALGDANVTSGRWLPEHSPSKKTNLTTDSSYQHLKRTQTLKRMRTGIPTSHSECEDGKTKKENNTKTVFADAADMKKRVKEAIMRPEYNVADFYKTTGICQKIARKSLFDNITLCVIALNAVWISIEVDHNKQATLMKAHPVFQVGENFFCIFFTGEVLIRLCAFENKTNCGRDFWFVFDSALVVLMVSETWLITAVFWLLGSDSQGALGNASILRLVRLLRLTRLARMVRLLRAMPELMILVKGVSVATRSVFFTLCLLTIVVYVFAIAFTQLTEDTVLEDKYFKTIPKSMSTLLLQGTLPDLAELVEDVGEVNGIYAVLMLIFILVSTLTVMNMLVGVLCEVVSVVSAVEKEQMNLQFVKMKILELLKETGVFHDKVTAGAVEEDVLISKTEFEQLLLMPEGARIIQEVGVDVVDLVDFSDHIFIDSTQLTFADFMDIILQLRGSNSATVRDIVDLRKLLKQISDSIEHIAKGQRSSPGAPPKPLS